jgi:predicted phosphoribosyltransferase
MGFSRKRSTNLFANPVPAPALALAQCLQKYHMEIQRYANRRQAGAALALRLDHYQGRSDVIVLALPRGGVPVAYEVARRLGVPLDVFVVRKLGLPGQPELAMGAIASGGVRVRNEEVLAWNSVPAAVFEAVARA